MRQALALLLVGAAALCSFARTIPLLAPVCTNQQLSLNVMQTDIYVLSLSRHPKGLLDL